ncbi:hypothetical protein CDL12_08836 [Handroanthus impetiginosus]|uniref:Uncharacterized protein n=1 Tax=Handroanthus impetiginosus TaxID=429701 RepID=A0A2G9HM33_9LAMI|nr:hypothetical protein CDL12_08836 [Handroanthus impetiginosus]
MATAGICQKVIDGFKWIISRIKYVLQFISKTVKKLRDWFNPFRDNFSEDFKEHCVSLTKSIDASVETTSNAFESGLSAFSKLFDSNLLPELCKLSMYFEELLSLMTEAEATVRRKNKIIDDQLKRSCQTTCELLVKKMVLLVIIFRRFS